MNLMDCGTAVDEFQLAEDVKVCSESSTGLTQLRGRISNANDVRFERREIWAIAIRSSCGTCIDSTYESSYRNAEMAGILPQSPRTMGRDSTKL